MYVSYCYNTKKFENSLLSNNYEMRNCYLIIDTSKGYHEA